MYKALERKTFSIFHIRCPVSTMSNYVLLLVISYKREKAFQLLAIIGIGNVVKRSESHQQFQNFHDSKEQFILLFQCCTLVLSQQCHYVAGPQSSRSGASKRIWVQTINGVLILSQALVGMSMGRVRSGLCPTQT